jgi:hypothetical protein
MDMFSAGAQPAGAEPSRADLAAMLREVAAETKARASRGAPAAAPAEENTQDALMARMITALQAPLMAKDLPSGVREDYVFIAKGKTTHDFAFGASRVLRRFEARDEDAVALTKAQATAKSAVTSASQAVVAEKKAAVPPADSATEAALAAHKKAHDAATLRVTTTAAAATAAAEKLAAAEEAAAASSAAAMEGFEPPCTEGELTGRTLFAFHQREANKALFAGTKERMQRCRDWFADYQSRLVFAVASFIDKKGVDECSNHKSNIKGAILRAEEKGPNPKEVARILEASADQMQDLFDRSVAAHIGEMVKEWRAKEAEYRGFEAVLDALNRIRPMRMLGRIYAETCAGDVGEKSEDGESADPEDPDPPTHRDGM